MSTTSPRTPIRIGRLSTARRVIGSTSADVSGGLLAEDRLWAAATCSVGAMVMMSSFLVAWVRSVSRCDQSANTLRLSSMKNR